MGPVDDWDNGSRGWIFWVGIGLILGDSAAGLVWVIGKPLMPWAQRQFRLQRLERLGGQVLEERERLLLHSLAIKDNKVDSAVDDNWPATSRVTLKLMLWTGAILLLLYFVSLLSVFQEFVPPFATLIAVVLIPFGGFISMRSLGETDNGAALAIGTSIPAAKSESAKKLTFRGRQSSAMHHRTTGPCIKLKPHLCKSYTQQCCRSRSLASFTTNRWFEDSIHDKDRAESNLL